MTGGWQVLQRQAQVQFLSSNEHVTAARVVNSAPDCETTPTHSAIADHLVTLHCKAEHCKQADVSASN